MEYFSEGRRSDMSVFRVLRDRAKQEPRALSHIFLRQDASELCRLDVSELDQRARAVAAAIQERVQTGDRVLLAAPVGPDYVIGFHACIYAGAVPVPMYPPANERGYARLMVIADDAAATLGLTVSTVYDKAGFTSLRERPSGGVDWLMIDAVDNVRAEDWIEPDANPDALAFIQYTSGSTGDPKGVMVPHRSLLSHVERVARKFGLTRDAVAVGWLPPFHDMGLIGFILLPAYLGFQTIILPPAAFLQKPVRWLEAISRYKATHSGGPNFAYDLCTDKVSDAQKKGLDLSQWRLAFCGAEPVRAQSWRRFSEAFESCGFRREAFYPCYGLAESVVMVTGPDAGCAPNTLRVDADALAMGRIVAADDGARELVGCGGPLKDHELLIVDPETRKERQFGEIGEIWVRGPSVAAGYWRKNQLTEEVFRTCLGEDDGRRFLRTGDLGFLAGDGELYVSGRLKDLIISRGRNIHPHDLEAAAQTAHPIFKGGRAVAFELDDERQGFAVLLEAAPSREAEFYAAIAAAQRTIVQESGVEPAMIAIVKRGALPVTSSGKIQRRASKNQLVNGGIKILAQRIAREHVKPRQGGSGAAARCETIASARIQTWLVEELARRVGAPASKIDIHEPFSSIGLDSMESIELTNALEAFLGCPVPATSIWDYPTVASLAEQFAAEAEKKSHAALSAAQLRTPSSEPIAIIGIGCRFPDSDGPEEFWNLLCEGRDPIRDAPLERWTMHDDAATELGRTFPRKGGYLEGVDRFDASLFSISPREARYMDPQQRLVLEVAWRALEDSGLSPRSTAGARAGVYLGVSNSDYGSLQFSDLEHISAYSGTGCAHSVAANRLSYFLDWRGPSIAIDTACSASLVATHLACRALRSGECDLALAGGVNLILTPQLSIAFHEAHMMATDGRCKAFDASADGYARSEGCGLVALKRLSDAHADGDRIIAIIRGSAQNQDGRSNGLTAPNGLAQQAVIAAALADAGLDPQRVGYVETHGTGTPLGDPIEVRAIAHALGVRDAESPLLLGAVKSNIGHLEAAAGVAGLIKAALSLYHRIIPGNLHFRALNPHIDLTDGRLRVVDRAVSWPSASAPRVAGVSSFGFGGANAHVVLEEPPRVEAERAASVLPLLLLAMSAADAERLGILAGRYADFIEENPEARLDDFCFTAACRTQFPHRRAFVGADHLELARKLRAFSSGDAGGGALVAARSARNATPGINFLFAELDSGAELIFADLCDAEPVFRDGYDECAAALECWAGATQGTTKKFDLRGVVEASSSAHATAFQIALAKHALSLGIEPKQIAFIGKGVFAAACACAALSVNDAIRLAASPSRDVFCAALESVELRSPDIGAGALICASGEFEPTDRDEWLKVFDALQNRSESGGAGVELQEEFTLEFSGALCLLSPQSDALATGPAQSLPAVRPDAESARSIYEIVAALYAGGCELNWSAHFARRGARRMAIPGYPFERQRHWLSAPAGSAALGGSRTTVDLQRLHPFIDRRVAANADKGATYEKLLRPSQEPLLSEHRLWGRALFPAAGFIDAALAAARLFTGNPQPTLKNVAIARPLVFEDDEAKEMRVELSAAASGQIDIRIAGAAHGLAPRRLDIERRGILDSLALRPAQRRAPGPGQIEISVRAAGLNFMDVMNAMGILPGDGDAPALGAECAGVVCAVGAGVTEFAPGQSVMAIAPASFGDYATTSAALAARMPASLSIEQAAGAPIAFLTAYYALVRLGKLAAGERALIHSAAGGVGLAAAQIAGEVGAEVLATVGSLEKHEVLRSMNVTRIADSRDLSFADRVRDWTDGQGVDVVLNSLSGDSIGASLSCLAPYGRFLEIGKTDIYSDAALRLYPFRRNLSYFAIDLSRMCVERPEFVGEMLREIAQKFESGAYAPTPFKAWPIERAAEAFRHMAMRKNIGKVVLRLGAESVRAAEDKAEAYVLGKAIVGGGEAPPAPLDIAAILARCGALREGAELYARFAEVGLDYGACFRCVDWVRYGGDEMLAQIRLPAAAAARAGHILHPTLLDGALQAFGAAFLDWDAGNLRDVVYVPATFDRINCRREQPALIYCHARRRSVEEGLLRGDLRLVTPDGDLLAVVEGVSLRRLSRSAALPKAATTVGSRSRTDAASWLRAPIWREIGRVNRIRRWRSGVTLLLARPGDFGERVAQHLEAVGDTCVRVVPDAAFIERGANSFGVNPRDPQDFERVFKRLRDRGVVRDSAPVRAIHLWTCAPPEPECDTLDALEARLTLAAHSLVFLTQALSKSVAGPATIVVSSANAQAADGAPLCAERAPLWAIGKTIPKEFEGIACRGVDLDLSAGATEDDVQAIIDAASPDADNGWVALREGRRLVMEMQPAPLAQGDIAFKSGDVLLVAGGLGGVAQALMSYISRQVAVRLALVGRSPANAEQNEAIAQFEKLGCEVATFCADIADLTAMQAVAAELRKRWGKIDGVIHCAGILRDGFMRNLDAAWLEAPLRPKIQGSWVLERVTRADKPRFFILASSMAALATPAGQCNHAAANAFEDAFAHALSRQGVRALSINWGPWGETGVIANEHYRKLLRTQGVHPFTTEEALSGFSLAIASGLTQVGVYALESSQHALQTRGALSSQETNGIDDPHIAALIEKVVGRAAELRADLGIERYAGLSKRIATMSDEFVAAAMRDLGCQSERSPQGNDCERLAEEAGVAPQHRRLFRHWLTAFAHGGDGSVLRN